jgi:hypothetical protein
LGSPQVEARYGMKLVHKFAALTVEKRTKDPHMTGPVYASRPRNSAGEFPDTVPQAIKLIDAKGRSCIYVPISQDGNVADSQGYILGPKDE